MDMEISKFPEDTSETLGIKKRTFGFEKDPIIELKGRIRGAHFVMGV